MRKKNITMLHCLAGVVGCFFVIGCIGPPRPLEPVVKTVAVAVPIEKTWPLAIEGLNEAGLLITGTDKASGLITVEKNLSGNEVPGYVVTPSLLSVHWDHAVIKANIYLKPVHEQGEQYLFLTRIFINSTMQCWYYNTGTYGEPLSDPKLAPSNFYDNSGLFEMKTFAAIFGKTNPYEQANMPQTKTIPSSKNGESSAKAKNNP